MNFRILSLIIAVLMFVDCQIDSQREHKTRQLVLTPKVDTLVNSDGPIYRSNDYGITWHQLSDNLPKTAQVSFIEMIGSRMVVATDNEGIYLSDSNLGQWEQIGPDLPGNKINALLIDSDIIYAGVYRGGVFKRNKNGQWQNLSHDLPDLRVQSLIKTQDRLIAGTDSGIFILRNSQKTWTSVFPNVQAVSLNKYDGHLIAGTNQGTLHSVDSGQNWDWIHKEGALHFTNILNGHIIEMYISGEVYISDNWGQSWWRSKYAPSHDSYIYEAAAIDNYWFMSNNHGVHRSSDQGENWSLVYPLSRPFYFDLLAVDNILYAGSRD